METRKVVKVNGPRPAGQGQAWDVIFETGEDADTLSEKCAGVLKGLVGQEAEFEFESRERQGRTYLKVVKVSKGGQTLYEKAAPGGGGWQGRNGSSPGEPKDETWIAIEVAAKEAGDTVRAWLALHPQTLDLDGAMAKIAHGTKAIALGMVAGREQLLGAQPSGKPDPQAAESTATGGGNGKAQDPEQAVLETLWEQAATQFGGKVKALKALNEHAGENYTTKNAPAEKLRALLQASGVSAAA